MLIVGGFITDAANDKEQLQPLVEAISPVVGDIENVLADSGYYSEAGVTRVEAGGRGPTVYAAIKRTPHGRSVAQLEERPDPEPPHQPGATVAETMAHRLETKIGRALYKLRKETVEPVFGIIKEVLGFRRFMLRGMEKGIESDLLKISYNLKKMYHLGMRFSPC